MLKAPLDANHWRKTFFPRIFFKDLVGLGGLFSAMYLWLLIA